jgi:hypothetical protein
MTIEQYHPRKDPLEAGRRQLVDRLAIIPANPVIELYPQAVANYQAIVRDLSGRIGELDLTTDRAAIDKFRSLLDRVIVHDAPSGRVEAEIIGSLTGLLGRPAGDVGDWW